MIIIKAAKFEAVEREKMHLLHLNVQHVDWLSKEELDSIRSASDEQTLSHDELANVKATLDKIVGKTKRSSTKQWASDLLVAVTTAQLK